uniref:Ig-like domain-containing protein n=1 Tax=Gopherus agassizii TaxID=38772 RepID=A0A452GQZ1_9SAUR
RLTDLLKTTVFHNASSRTMEGLALLRDLRTHSMDCSTCKIRFLQPWAHQGLTPKQCVSLFLPLPLSPPPPGNLPMACPHCPAIPIPDPFVLQASIGCELHPNGTSRQFCDAAVNGEDFISFSVDEGTWVARHRHKLALISRDFLNQDKSTTAMAQFLLRTTCINELKSFVQYGKESLERQGEAGSPPPSGTPALVLLVCRVTSFYPRPVRVAWLQDGEEVAAGWRLNSSGILPNADLTYQLRSSLAVGPGDGHSYACRVQHSSLGGQSLLLPWGRCMSPGGEGGHNLWVLFLVHLPTQRWR